MSGRDAGGVEVSAPPSIGRMIREPIPVAPFLAFIARREEQIRRDLDEYPAISDSGRHGGGPSIDARARLVMSLGWDPSIGMRKLYRWSHPESGDGHSGYVDRAEIEDALRNVGVDIEDVYSNLPAPSPWPVRLGQGRRMTDAQVIAAHTVYIKSRMTTTSLAELIWERFGFPSVPSCRQSLGTAFKGLGLPTRQCAATTRHGLRCRKQPGHHSDFCAEHDETVTHPSAVAALARKRVRDQMLAFGRAA